MMETLTAIRRAGADIIITYFARDAARALRRIGVETKWIRPSSRLVQGSVPLTLSEEKPRQQPEALARAQTDPARRRRTAPSARSRRSAASPLFIRRASGATHRGRRRQPLHRLRHVVGTADPRTRAARPRRRPSPRAARHGTSFGAPSPLEHELGERVRALVPSMERVRFVSSGTEAAMSAVRVARAFTGRDRIVKFEGCYHGHADAFLVKAGSGRDDARRADESRRRRGRWRPIRCSRATTTSHRSKRCATHTPGQSPPSSSSRSPATWASCRRPRAFCRACATLATRHGILLIFDEVISGFRASAGGAQALFGVAPDLTCLGKIIGGGLPVGAYGGRADIMDMVAPAGPVYQAGTLSGNPVAMTAGLWALKRLTPRLYKDLARRGSQLGGRPRRRGARRQACRCRSTRSGRCVTPFFTAAPVRDYDSALTANTTAYAAFFRGMLARGRLSAAVTVRGVVSVGGPHRPRTCSRRSRRRAAAMREVARRHLNHEWLDELEGHEALT